MDFAVESLAHGVGDGILEIAEESFEMFLKHPRYFHDGFELAPHRPAIPVTENCRPEGCVARVPKFDKGFLDGPCPGRFQVAVAEGLEDVFMLGSSVGLGV